MIRCDWAQPGLEAIGRDAAVVIVDVFSFGTAVTLAVERGAIVYPWPGAAAGAADFARRRNAILCTDRSRTTFEDWLGAGAVLASLGGEQSSEARAAAAVFAASRAGLTEILAGSVSGRELASRGFAGDVALAGDYDSSFVVPVVDRDGWLVAI